MLDLSELQAALSQGETTITVPAEAQNEDLPAIASCIKGAKGITLDLSGTAITVIGKRTFASCSALKTVILPSTLTSISDYAFLMCDSLTSITIPASVTYVGSSTFGGCDKLAKIDVALGSKSYASVDDVLFSKDKATLVCFPAGKEGEYYEVPSETVTIGDGAFFGCTGLKAVKLSDGVKSIGDSAFSWCNNLISVAIPKSVTSIGSDVFKGCDKLDDKGKDGFAIEQGILVRYTGNAQKVTIPAGVKSIGDDAFKGCKNLTSVTIPSSVTSIGERAFSWCESLTSIVIPDSVTSIGSSAFEWCENLTSITIGVGVTSIGEWVFYRCKRLTSITFESTGGWYLDEGFTQSVGSWELSSRVKAGKALYMRCD